MWQLEFAREPDTDVHGDRGAADPPPGHGHAWVTDKVVHGRVQRRKEGTRRGLQSFRGVRPQHMMAAGQPVPKRIALPLSYAMRVTEVA